MNLNALADFCLIAAQGGLGKASRVSGRSKATLSRRVAELEEELGLRLVERGPKGLVITPAGALLLAKSEGPLQELEEAASAAKEGLSRPRGTLRIAAPLLFSQLALGRLCAEFMLRYPDVRIEAVAEDRVADLVEERFDVAIRPNPDQQSNLVGRCFARDRLVVVAAPSFARPQESADGAVVPAVGMTQAGPGAWSLDGGKLTLQPHYVLRFSSLLMVRDAVAAGAGAGLLPQSLVARHLDDGRLVAWGEADGRAVELWVLHTSRRLTSPKVQAFVEFICKEYAGGDLTL